MYRVVYALVVGLSVSAPSLAQQSIIGTYKLASMQRDVDGKPDQMSGAPPHGYLMIAPKTYVLFFTEGTRKYGTSDAEKAALWGSMSAYGGSYRVEGRKFVMLPDTSFNEISNGTQEVRNWEMKGNRLVLVSDPRPWPRDPSKKIITRFEWEKIE
jgi:hypothetical protein